MLPQDSIILPTYHEIKQDKVAYAKSFKIQYDNTDPYSGKPLVEEYDGTYVVQNESLIFLLKENILIGYMA